MKKRLFTAFIAVVMLVSMLPCGVSAAAADHAVEIRLSKEVVSGEFPTSEDPDAAWTDPMDMELLRVDFYYKSGTEKPWSVMAYLKYDATKLYPFANYSYELGNVAYKMTDFSTNWAADMTVDNYLTPATPASQSKEAEVMLYSKVENGMGYLNWKVTALETNRAKIVALPDYTLMSSLYLGLKDGVSFDSFPADAISFYDPNVDTGITAPQTIDIWTYDGENQYQYNPFRGVSDLDAPAIVAVEDGGVKFAGSEPEVPEALNLAAEATATTAKATLSSTYAEAKSGLLIVAAYNADGLVAVNSKSVTVTKEDGDYVDVTFAATEGVTEVKAFLWSDFVNRTPLLAAATAAPVAE